MGRIEADPTPPHGGLVRNHRGDLAHADFERVVAGSEICPPECVNEVDGSEHKDDARAEDHENFCGQNALPDCAAPGCGRPIILCCIVLSTKLQTKLSAARIRFPAVEFVGTWESISSGWHPRERTGKQDRKHTLLF